MADNVKFFLQTLAVENRTSKSQSEMLQVRKTAEKRRAQQKVRNLRNRIKELVAELTTAEINLRCIDEDLKRLGEAVERGDGD